MGPSLRTERAPVSRKHRPDVLLLLFMGILVLLGLIVIYAISPPLAARAGSDVDPNHYMYRQLLYLLAGVGGFVVTYLVPIDWWRKAQGKFLIGALIVGVLPFILATTPLSVCANGACRWLNLGFTTFQPAELMKFALVIFLASFLAIRIQQGKVNDIHSTLIPIGMIVLAIAVIVIGLQKDLGTGLTFFGVVMCMLLVAGVKARYLIGALIIGASLVAVFTIVTPGRIERILTFVNHSSVTTDATGYHINQALIAVGSGGLTGKGLGQSVQAFGYLPEAANDSIFAILAEIFGFLGTTAVIIIFAVLLVRMLKVVDSSANIYYKLVAAGIFGWVASHTVINIGAMLGIFPLTGITLPFVSFGGTSLLFMLAAMGLLLQISRYTGHQVRTEVTGGTYEDRRRRRGFGRPRDAGFGSTA